MPTEMYADRVGELRVGYWKFPIYVGDTSAFGAQGMLDTRTGNIVLHDGLPEDHLWPVLAHEAIEAVSHIWGNSLSLSHIQVSILGDALGSMMPSLFLAWFTLASDEMRREIIGSIFEQMQVEEDGVDDMDSGEGDSESETPPDL